MALLRRRRHVEGRVAVEEASRLEYEAAPVDRHYRPILDAWEMGRSEDMPEDNVGAVDIAVGARVGGDATAAGMLVDVIARRISLRVIVLRHPQVLRGKSRAAIQR